MNGIESSQEHTFKVCCLHSKYPPSAILETLLVKMGFGEPQKAYQYYILSLLSTYVVVYCYQVQIYNQWFGHSEMYIFTGLKKVSLPIWKEDLIQC